MQMLADDAKLSLARGADYADPTLGHAVQQMLANLWRAIVLREQSVSAATHLAQHVSTLTQD